MKSNKLTACVLLAALFSPSASVLAGGIPVFDGVSNIQRAQEFLREMQNWQQTVQHYKSQLRSYQDQLATATGVRDVQQFINQAKSMKNEIKALQERGLSLNDFILSDNLPTGDLERIYDKYKSFDVCDPKADSSIATVCKQEVVNKAWQIEQTSEVEKKINDTLTNINQLADRISYSKDSKESQDLANSIQAQSVHLNVLSTQWEMNIKSAEQRDKLLEAKRQKAFREQQAKASVPTY
ncbi:TPA: type IV secretion system protein [Serratia liquefaciens]|nr:type IV secretion system protein [Serratia liquefaciens]